MKKKVLVCAVMCLVFLLSLTACGNNATSGYIDSAIQITDDYLYGKLTSDEATSRLDTIESMLESISDDSNAELARLVVMRISSQINMHHFNTLKKDSSSTKQSLQDISDTKAELSALKGK